MPASQRCCSRARWPSPVYSMEASDSRRLWESGQWNHSDEMNLKLQPCSRPTSHLHGWPTSPPPMRSNSVNHAYLHSSIPTTSPLVLLLVLLLQHNNLQHHLNVRPTVSTTVQDCRKVSTLSKLLIRASVTHLYI